MDKFMCPEGEALADAYPDPLKTWRDHSPAAARWHGISVWGAWALVATSTSKSALIALLVTR